MYDVKMKLDPQHFCYMTKTDFRVLTAIEVGMRNHQYMPLQLISTTANLRSCGLSTVLSSLLKAKLIVHCAKAYDGYKLTFLGLDFLAIRALFKRGIVASIGRRIGVGKEADVHLCTDKDGNLIVLKLHRLGRISFRSIKHNRDYMGRRKHASWMYLSQIAAKKEYSYLRSLYDARFPVPEPLDVNRHVIAMKFIDAIPLSQVREMANPKRVLDKLMDLVVRLAQMGIIHGDFNGFNLMISEDGSKITVIDFPQVIPVDHENAAYYFNRDVECIRDMFHRQFKLEVVEYPKFSQVVDAQTLQADEAKATKIKIDINQVDENLLNEIFDKMQGIEDECAQMEKLELGAGDNDDIQDFAPLDIQDDENCNGDSTSNIQEYAEDDAEEQPGFSSWESSSSESENEDDGSCESENESEILQTRGRVIQPWTPDIKRATVQAYRRKLGANAKPKNKCKYKPKNKHKMALY